MTLDADAMVDRRRLKRLLNWWRAGAVVLGAALVIVLIGRATGFADGHYVARLTVSGIVTDSPERDRLLRKIADDADAEALILRIDSPGGTFVGGESLYLGLRAVAKKKPVVAVLGTVAASAAYMTALGADHIVAREGTVTGSIGVILQTTDVTGFLRKLGISTEAIKSAPLKAVPSPLEPLTPEGREASRAVVDDMFDMFVDLVAARRGLAREEALRLADGRVFTGRQALKVKLVDALGGEAEARAWLEAKHGVDRGVKPRDLRPERFDLPLWRVVAALVTEKTVFSERLTLDGLVSLWHPNLN